MTPADGMDVLDDPVATSLRGAHAHLSRSYGTALTYDAGVSTFAAVPSHPSERDWDDLAVLLGSGQLADLFSSPEVPPGWPRVFSNQGRQMIGPSAPLRRHHDDVGIVRLGAADVPAMLELTGETRPGPFFAGTHQMGAYLGVRQHGRLVAMAGERLRPPGWTEISAVCTAPHARGQGLAGRLVGELVEHVLERGERPFLHVSGQNAAAVAVYERLGFRTRRTVTFQGFTTP